VIVRKGVPLPDDCDIDREPLRREVLRTLDRVMRPLEIVEDESLSVDVGDTTCRVLVDGVEEGRFDRVLVRTFNPKQLKPLVIEALREFPPQFARRVRALLEDGVPLDVHCPPDSDYVGVSVTDIPSARVHRSHLVAGYTRNLDPSS
jgi:hypothetical protein